ncbi:con-Ins F2-like [Stylophora pistillata]|uniref:con-Ins F2-like n=1 Tax=Stylophora pistillata TaxID=50429 RepID=UPI000C04D278|nr:con-Ins F2-like [Stylophora pistillata]
MKNLHFWRTTALLTFLLCIGNVSGYKPYKSREVGSRRILGHFCGPHINLAYDFVCIRGKGGKREQRSTALKEKEALSFLGKSRTPRYTAHTDIVEECCKEGCAVEEIHEYCW